MTDTPTAGGRIKAATTPAPYMQSAACTVSLPTSSSTPANLVGAAITITTAQPNAVVQVVGVFDMTVGSPGGFGIGTLVVDGVTQPAQAIKGLDTAGDRVTAAQAWTVPLATAGSHTFQLQGSGSSPGPVTFGSTHTTINMTVFDW